MKMLKNLKNLKMFTAGFLACLVLTSLLSAAFAAEDLSSQLVIGMLFVQAEPLWGCRGDLVLDKFQ